MSPDNTSHAALVSPCINVCRLDESNMCVGCGRLLGEIATWSRMSVAQRETVRQQAARRLEEASRVAGNV